MKVIVVKMKAKVGQNTKFEGVEIGGDAAPSDQFLAIGGGDSVDSSPNCG